MQLVATLKKAKNMQSPLFKQKREKSNITPRLHLQDWKDTHGYLIEHSSPDTPQFQCDEKARDTCRRENVDENPCLMSTSVLNTIVDTCTCTVTQYLRDRSVRHACMDLVEFQLYKEYWLHYGTATNLCIIRSWFKYVSQLNRNKRRASRPSWSLGSLRC